jgi:hypothetical protein
MKLEIWIVDSMEIMHNSSTFCITSIFLNVPTSNFTINVCFLLLPTSYVARFKILAPILSELSSLNFHEKCCLFPFTSLYLTCIFCQ